MKKRQKTNKIVLAFGTFDILHPGHLYYLSECKKYGDTLVVVIARDETVFAVKGSYPIFSEKDRRALIASLAIVDEALLGDKIHHCRIIDKVRPDVLCLGYDQNITKQKLGEQLKRMTIPIQKIIRIKPYRPSIHKSTVYRNKAVQHTQCKPRLDTAKMIV